MSEYAVMAVIKHLFDKLKVDAVERIMSYLETYLDQREHEIDREEG